MTKGRPFSVDWCCRFLRMSLQSKFRFDDSDICMYLWYWWSYEVVKHSIWCQFVDWMSQPLYISWSRYLEGPRKVITGIRIPGPETGKISHSWKFSWDLAKTNSQKSICVSRFGLESQDCQQNSHSFLKKNFLSLSQKLKPMKFLVLVSKHKIRRNEFAFSSQNMKNSLSLDTDLDPS